MKFANGVAISVYLVRIKNLLPYLIIKYWVVAY